MAYTRLHWHQGVPFSDQYGDIYFSPQNGLAESRQVFLHASDLPSRWQQSDQFVIAETGFGTGLNFLATWFCWQNDAKSCKKLHYIAVDNAPLDPSDLSRTHSFWPELSDLSAKLLAQYPLPIPGFHRLHFAEVTLTLIWGEACEQLAELLAKVDAWFLDGFAPAKNPNMWTEQLCQIIADRSNPGASIATFTAAGHVKRKLQQVGFAVHKCRGFGHKRERITGSYRPDAQQHDPYKLAPWFELPQVAPDLAEVAIIGGGLAGCASAAALARCGISSTIFEAQSCLAAGASQNPVALIHGKLSANCNYQDMLLTNGALYSLQVLAHAKVRLLRSGLLHLEVSKRQTERFEKILANRMLANNCLRLVDAKQASILAGIKLDVGGYFIPWAACCDPREACQALASSSLINTCLDSKIDQLWYQDAAWHLRDHQQVVHRFTKVVIANAYAAQQLAPTANLPIYQTPGQVSLPAQVDEQLKTALSFDGYLTPALNGRQVLGASYRHDGNTAVTAQDHASNIAALSGAAPKLALQFEQQQLTGLVGTRAVTSDHLPIVGALADSDHFAYDYHRLKYGDNRAGYPLACYQPGLYVSLAHGSKGLASALLSGELIAALLTGNPLPVSKTIYQALHPSRFWYRQLKLN